MIVVLLRLGQGYVNFCCQLNDISSLNLDKNFLVMGLFLLVTSFAIVVASKIRKYYTLVKRAVFGNRNLE